MFALFEFEIFAKTCRHAYASKTNENESKNIFNNFFIDQISYVSLTTT